MSTTERRYRAIIEKSWDAVALLGRDGAVLYASPSTSRILGYPADRLVGRNLFELLHADDGAAARAAFTDLVRRPGASLTVTFRCRHQDGSWRWLENIYTNLLDEPGVEAVVANYHDITEYKRLEEDLRHRAESLAEAGRRREQFLAMLAHELRNPLAPVLNGLHVLRLAGSDRKTVEQARSMMERQIKHMARLVDDLLDMSRVTRDKIELQRGRLDLARLVRTAAEDYRATLERAGLILTVDVPEPPVWITGDGTRLTQVVNSFLSNCVKFTDRGGHVWVRLHVDGVARQAVLSVADDGIGIDPQMLPQLFDVFAQADRTLHRTRGGLGLGLALIKGLVQMHGGTVEVHSDGPGRGAAFTVRLPFEDEPAALAESAPAPADLVKLLVTAPH
jgi:PAS domain S-box-containing protein